MLPKVGRLYFVAYTTLELNIKLEKRFAPISTTTCANQLKWRPPAELIRTLGSVPISIPIIDAETIPMYQKIAPEVLYLKKLGYSQRRIARTIGVHAKVVSQAIKYQLLETKNQ